MNLQLFGQTFDPDNVTMYEQKDGTIPQKYTELILKEVMNGSQIMKLAKYEKWTGKKRSLNTLPKVREHTG